MARTRATSRRRVSKAAVLRSLKQAEAAATATRELPEPLLAIIDDFHGRGVTEESRPAIRGFLREVIAASPLVGAESVRKHCRHLAGLAAYALQRGFPLTTSEVMQTRLIDEYVRLGMPGASDALKAERRRRLLALARAVNPGPTAPAKLAPIGHSAIKPCYTPAEAAAIRRVATSQPTAARTRDLSAVVGLGAGAGLDSVDLRHLKVRDIKDLGEQGLVVHVGGPRPRLVPVRRTYEDLVRSAIAGRAATALVIGVKKDRRNTAARAAEGAALIGVPHIEPSRLRATWLADVMTDSIPIGLILQAAGLKSARTLSELLPHLTPWLDHKGLRVDSDALRGGAR